jgi:hypothetical protein
VFLILAIPFDGLPHDEVKRDNSWNATSKKALREKNRVM